MSRKNYEIKETYTMWQNHTVSRKEYAQILCASLKEYILSLCKEMRKGYDAEDIIQLGYLSIIDNMDNYNPFHSTPTTYFTPYILEYTKFGDRAEISKHFKDTETHLNKMALLYGYEGMWDSDLTDEELSRISNTSLCTVRETRRICKYKQVPFDECYREDLFEITEKTPIEDIICNAENTIELARAKEKLTDLQRFLIDVLIENPRNPKYDAEASVWDDDISTTRLLRKRSEPLTRCGLVKIVKEYSGNEKITYLDIEKEVSTGLDVLRMHFGIEPLNIFPEEISILKKKPEKKVIVISGFEVHEL